MRRTTPITTPRKPVDPEGARQRPCLLCQEGVRRTDETTFLGSALVHARCVEDRQGDLDAGAELPF